MPKNHNIQIGQMRHNILLLIIDWIQISRSQTIITLDPHQVGPDEPQPHPATLPLPPAELQAADAGGGAGHLRLLQRQHHHCHLCQYPPNLQTPNSFKIGPNTIFIG